MRFLPLLAFAACVLSFGQNGPAPGADNQKEALAVVQRCFDAMAAHDGDAIRALFLPAAQLSVVRGDGTSNTTAVEQFAAHVAEMKEPIIERIWNPTVLVSGRLAEVWAEYDFHRSGKFSHCGVDAVHLLKTEAGWKIASIAYTAETSACKPSPLGELRP